MELALQFEATTSLKYAVTTIHHTQRDDDPCNSTCSATSALLNAESILWFDPRREHSSVPTAKSRSRRAQGLSRLAASSRPPEGLGLDWPEHGGTLDRYGLEAAAISAGTGAVGSLAHIRNAAEALVT